MLVTGKVAAKKCWAIFRESMSKTSHRFLSYSSCDASSIYRASGRAPADSPRCQSLDLVPLSHPRSGWLLTFLFASFLTLLLLLTVSFSVGQVLAPQGYEKIAFATPAASGRSLHRHEVTAFGERVREAFGIERHVAHEFADWILEASIRQALSPELLASLVVTESSFRKTVRSAVGAIGPAQVRPEYWGDFCGHADELHDPEQNIYCGAQVLSHFMERCAGDIPCALAAYNVGPHARRVGAANRYVKKIDGYLASFDELTL